MKRVAKAKRRHELILRLRRRSDVAMGPGKADLLALIASTGSIAAAGREMGMSYRRAWLLVRTMNDCFRKPLIVAAKGGHAGGGAQLTLLGAQVLKRYRAMQRKAERAAAAELAKLRRLLRR